MNIFNTIELVEQLRQTLEARNYNAFVDLFAADAIFEVPFGIEENKKRLEGIDAIRTHFNTVAQNPAAKLLELDKVSAIVNLSNDPGTVTVEFSIQGRSVTTGKPFNMPSSVAIIQCFQGTVKHYKDFPNTLGYAQIAGMLPQFAASLTK